MLVVRGQVLPSPLALFSLKTLHDAHRLVSGMRVNSCVGADAFCEKCTNALEETRFPSTVASDCKSVLTEPGGA